MFVIGLNDAEHLFPCSVSIFHADWVQQALATKGETAKLYLTSTDFQPRTAEICRVPFRPLKQDNTDLMLQRLLADTIEVEEILFLTALKLARVLAEARGRRQTVLCVGLDFDETGTAAADVDRSFDPATPDQRRLRLGLQEQAFLSAVYMLGDAPIDVIHVGNRPYSRFPPQALARGPRPRLRALDDARVAIVAELTTNHFGDLGRLEQMVRAAAKAGADFVKVQKRDVENFYSKEQLAAPYRSPFGTTFGDYRKQLELGQNGFELLSALSAELGIGWFASVLDLPSYEYVRAFDPAMIKLPSTISDHRSLISHVARTADRPIVLSTGMTDAEYESFVLDTFAEVSLLYLLQCNSAYPTPATECHIAVVRRYHRLAQQKLWLRAGYSSHDEGWFGSALAVAAGARMIEKHVKLGRTDWAHFDSVALDLNTKEFSNFVEKIREAEVLVGQEEKALQPSEHHKYTPGPTPEAVRG